MIFSAYLGYRNQESGFGEAKANCKLGSVVKPINGFVVKNLQIATIYNTNRYGIVRDKLLE